MFRLPRKPLQFVAIIEGVLRTYHTTVIDDNSGKLV